MSESCRLAESRLQGSARIVFPQTFPMLLVLVFARGQQMGSINRRNIGLIGANRRQAALRNPSTERSQASSWFQLAERRATKPSFGSDFPQVAEGRLGDAGSNQAISVERDSVRKEQLLEPLSLFE
jgi:hypothetical protein